LSNYQHFQKALPGAPILQLPLNSSIWLELNGVLIGYTIRDQSDRELLHSIGRKYGLIPLCPDEVVDIDVSGQGGIIGFFVRTMFGKLYISSRSA